NMGRPPIGDRAMTNAERIAKWRKRHADKLARKAARRGQRGPVTMDHLQALMPTLDDFDLWAPGAVMKLRLNTQQTAPGLCLQMPYSGRRQHQQPTPDNKTSADCA